jgi:hypothetical protein
MKTQGREKQRKRTECDKTCPTQYSIKFFGFYVK